MTSQPQITLINEGVMKCRFSGIYKKYVQGDVDGTIAATKETLKIIENAVENEMSPDLTEYFVDMLERTLMEVKNCMLGCTKERLWTLGYTNDLYM